MARYVITIEHRVMNSAPDAPKIILNTGQLLPEGEYVAIPRAEYERERAVIVGIYRSIREDLAGDKE